MDEEWSMPEQYRVMQLGLRGREGTWREGRMYRHVLNRMKERMRKRSGERAFHAIGQFHAIGTESPDWSGVRDVCVICE